jgi:hypothetical protein
MRLQRLSCVFFLLGFYSAAFFWMTYPLGLNLGTHFVIDNADPRAMGDGGMFVWNLDNFATSLAAHQNPFSTDRILYPVGANLWFHTYTPIAGAAARLFASPIATLNAFLFLHFVLSGVGCYALARRFVEDRRLCALAGFAFSFCPYKLAHLLGHFNLELTATLPMFASCFVSLCRPPEHRRVPRWAWALGTGIAFLLTIAADYYYAYYLVWFAFAYALYWRHEDWLSARLGRARRWAPAILLLSTIVTVVGKDVLDIETHGPFGYSADLFAYLLPYAIRRAIHIETVEHDIYAGVVVSALLVLYVASRCHERASKELRALSFSCVVFFALSMPAVRVAGTRLAYLPTALLHLVPLVNHARVPARFSIMVMLLAPILAMVAIEKKIFVRLGSSKRALLVAVLALGLVVDFRRADYFMTSSAQIPAVYRALAERPAGTLLEIPFGIRDGLRQAGAERTSAMWFQTVHHKKLVSGMVARLPTSTFDRFASEPMMGDLFSLEAASASPSLPARTCEEVRAFVRQFDLKYILIAPEYRRTRAEQYVRNTFGPLAVSTEELDGFWLVTLDAPAACAS